MKRAALLLALLAASSAGAQLEQQPTQFDDEGEAPEGVPPKQPQLTKPPELLEGREPEYPAAAFADGREGVVVMLLEIDATGHVSRVSVVEGAGEDLDAAAVAAAQRFVFSPAEWDGVPGPIGIHYRQAFELDEVTVEVEVDAEPPPGDGAVAVSGPVNFVGVVREGGTNEPLEGVEVYLELPGSDEGMVAFTDANGRFSFRAVPVGLHRVTYTLNGYQASFIEESFEEKVRTAVVVYLRPLASGAFETVIREQRAQKEVAKIALTREEVKRVPGTFGDPIRVLENLPGMARAPYAGGALIVRGANPQDTGVYFDSVPIPRLYHFGGLKSVVNAEFLEDIAFYPGGFGARYGRATAGIADVSSRALTMKRPHGAADVSLIDSSFFFGAPLELVDGLPAITVAAAGRRSYIDALLPIALETFAPGAGILVSPIYWDYQLKLETSPLPGQTFSLFAFGSSDDLKVLGGNQNQDDDDEEGGFNLGVLQRFHRVVGKWRLLLPDHLTHTLAPFVGIDETNVGLGAGDLDAGITQLSLSWGARDELRWSPSDVLEVVLGVDYLASTYSNDFTIPTFGPSEVAGFPRVYDRFEPGDPETITDSGVSHGLGFYVESAVSPLPWLKLVPGLRADLYWFQFDDPDAKRTLDEPLPAPLGEAYLWSADPRLTVRITPLAGTTLKAAAGVYRQPPTLNQLHVERGNPELDQPRAVQLIAGIEQQLTRALALDVQAYLTSRDLLVQSAGGGFGGGGFGGGGGGPPGGGGGGGGGDDDDDDDEPESDNGGSGDTVGVEILLRHSPARYSLAWLDDLYRDAWPSLHPAWMSELLHEVTAFGWIAYTLSRTVVDVDPEGDERLPSSFDQTHILTVVGQLGLPLDVSLGARFRLVSGSPTTLPLGSVQDLDTNDYRAVASSVRGRLPTFHQLDVRIDKHLVFDNFSLTPYLDLLNVYNATNAEAYVTDYRSVEQQALPGLTFLPNLGLSGDF